MGRFVNADCMLASGMDISTYNMFAYCGNNPINHSDSTGQWFGLDDVIAGVVGAVVGLASQLVSDVVTSVCSNSWQFSSWQTYVGAGIGGAIGGVTTMYAGPIIGAAVGAGSSTLIGQTLENVTGGEKRSAKDIVKNTAIDATIGAVVSKVAPIKVSNITIGRNSMSAVFSSGLTKLGNKTASRMSVKVIGKGIASGITSSLNVSSSIGIRNYMSLSFEQYYNSSKKSLNEPLYWCAP